MDDGNPYFDNGYAPTESDLRCNQQIIANIINYLMMCTNFYLNKKKRQLNNGFRKIVHCCKKIIFFLMTFLYHDCYFVVWCRALMLFEDTYVGCQSTKLKFKKNEKIRRSCTTCMIFETMPLIQIMVSQAL